LKKIAVPFDYGKVAHIVDQWVPEWRRMGFSGVVAVARGGLVPGVMAATALSIPLYALKYQRAERSVCWWTREIPVQGSRVLLVDDIAGRGTTLLDCHAFLADSYDVRLCTLVSDDASRVQTDWSTGLGTGLRAWFPWEREAITAGFDDTANLPPAPEYSYASWAIDLDGVLLPDLPEERYAEDLLGTLAQRDIISPAFHLPPFDLGGITIITGRPRGDRERTLAWLHQHGFHGPLVMRDETLFPVDKTPEHKAQQLHIGCHTHFLESCPKQAIRIARLAPVAKVFWWVGDGSAHLVRSAAADLLHS
jgi:hypothetical protein